MNHGARSSTAASHFAGRKNPLLHAFSTDSCHSLLFACTALLTFDCIPWFRQEADADVLSLQHNNTLSPGKSRRKKRPGKRTPSKSSKCKTERSPSPPEPKRLKFEPDSGDEDQEHDGSGQELEPEGSDQASHDDEDDKPFPGSDDEDIFKGKYALKSGPAASAAKSLPSTPKASTPAPKKPLGISDDVMNTIPDSVTATLA